MSWPDFKAHRCSFRPRAWIIVVLLASAVSVAAQTGTPGISASAVLAPMGRTTITWSAAGGSTAEVWVSINGAPEVLFAGESTSGSQDANWIDAGSVYTFRLYEGTGHSKLLGSIDVRRATEPAFIRASPNPVWTDRTGFNGRTTIEWNTGDGKPGTVVVSINDGPELLVSTGSRGTAEVPYIRLDASAVFRLYGETRQLLAAVDVRARTPAARTAATWVFLASLLILIAGSYARRDAAGFRRNSYPVLAAAMTVAALLPVFARSARPLESQPFPDAHEYADAARQLASGKGYVTHVHVNDTWPDDGQARPPKYPPGFSLALLPFAAFGSFPGDVLDAARWFAALYVIAGVAAAWSLGGPLAGLLAAGFIGISPFAEQSASVLLADAFGAALTALLIALLNKSTAPRAAAAGAIAGIGVLLRFSLIFNIAAVVLATRGRARRIALLCAVPGLAALFVYQWLTFGSPLKTGYGYWSPSVKRFDWSYVVAWSERPPGVAFPDLMHGKMMRWACPCPEGGPQSALPNILFHPAVLAGFFWIFAPPFVPIFGAVYLWRHRRAPPATAAIAIVVPTVGLYVFHFYQSERFMSPAALLLTVFSAVAIAGWAERRRGISAGERPGSDLPPDRSGRP